MKTFSRFLRMPTAPSSFIFAEAARRLDSRLLPIMSYDMSHLRLSHQIAPVAYVEIHNLATQKLSLKQFSAGNYTTASKGLTKLKVFSRGDDTEVLSESVLLDIKDVKTFHRNIY